MTIRLPEDVKRIIAVLEAHGFSAYAVGGCVRDSVLGRTPNDWDITTSARPEQIKPLFRRTIDTGIAHGTVTVILNNTPYEVTTYRIDGKYSDNRHPDEVIFTPELSEDLRRRDFTINAMAYNEREGLIDLFGGREDLERKIMRAVGDPEERFREDALRIMRCVRFSAQLNFGIDPATMAGMAALSANLSSISRERVREELLKTLLSEHPEKLSLLVTINAMEGICPGFSRREEEVYREIRGLPNEKIFRLLALLREDDAADRFFRELRFDRNTWDRVVHILAFIRREIPENDLGMRYFLAEFGTEDVDYYLRYREVRTGKSTAALLKSSEDIMRRGDCVSVKQLRISGQDLIAMGMKPGKAMGQLLSELLGFVLEDPARNENGLLLSEAEKRFLAISGKT